ncbi:MAG: hypothetical protein IPL52_10480 [Flavobacteriales bacterium]|nr:hypothetical protein [Flavobacteriales bacterium]
MIGGDFFFYDALGRYRLTRLNNDGSWNTRAGDRCEPFRGGGGPAPRWKVAHRWKFHPYNGEVGRRGPAQRRRYTGH